MSVSVGTAVCVLNFHFRGHKVTQVPPWMKSLLLIKNKKSSSSVTNKEQSSKLKIQEGISLKPSPSSVATSRSSINKLNPSIPSASNLNSLNHKNIIYLNETKPRQDKGEHNSKYSNSLYALATNTIINNNSKSINIIRENAFNKSYSKDDDLNSIQIVNNCKKIKTVKSDLIPNVRHQSMSKASDLSRESLERIFKLIKRSVRLVDKNRIKNINYQNVYDEWKEVASRIDFILFCIASTVVIATPILLFGKFFIRDESFSTFAINRSCGCGY